jgi:hypothetical protein
MLSFFAVCAITIRVASQNQIDQFFPTDFANPPQFSQKLNKVIDFLGSRVARIEGTSDTEVRLGRIVTPRVRTDNTEIPKDEREYLTLGASKKLYSPTVLRQSLVTRRWVDGTPIQPLPARTIDDLIEFFQGTETERLDTDAGSLVEGSVWYETDREVYFIVRSDGWHYLAGVMQAAFASRPSGLGTLDDGFQFWATDYKHLWQFDGANWHVLGGVLRDALANIPADLTADDTNFKFEATDYDRKWWWDGSAWDYQPGYKHFGIDWLMEAPGTGWIIADGTGSPATRTTAAGGTTTFTVPDLIDAFPYGIAAYTGAQEAAVAPVITGATAADGEHSHEEGTLAAVSNGAHTHGGGTLAAANAGSHTHSVSGSTGAPSSTAGSNIAAGATPLDIATHTHTVSATAASDGDHTHSISGTTASDGAHAHTIDGATAVEPDHTHGVGTLVVDDTAKPLRVGLLPYIRL